MNSKRLSVMYSIFQAVLDVGCVYLAYMVAFWLRFDTANGTPAYYWDSYWVLMPQSAAICLLVFVLFKFYTTMWQFASFDELIQIVVGTTIACAAIAGFGILLAEPLYGVSQFPRSVFIIGWVLTLIFVGTTRFGFRFLRRLRGKNFAKPRDPADFHRVMIIGAGEIGSMVIKAMKASPANQGIPVVAVDDNRAKRGTRIHGVKVVGGRDSIPKMASRYNVDQIVMAIPASSRQERQEIVNICSRTGCQLKTVPSIQEMLENQDDPLPVRNVDIIDLLGREEITLNVEAISGYLKNKVVLVTGGGGSIGSELCRQIARYEPKKLIVFDIYENNAYDLQNELLRKFPDLNLEVLIGSVRDKARLEAMFEICRPNVVFHAAAHKHVPLMELSPGEAVKNNVFGTMNVAEAAHKFGANQMVLISTDKAVNPTNVMGATKRICELIIQYYSRHSTTTEFVAVRFGNVLGSNGSVIPLFKRQIEAGGPVTVTHPDITRFFMTIPEAARLVIQAGGMAKGGEIFVLDMGQPVKIVDLARNLIQLSGLVPDVDIQIEYTGLRPGEKLYEELLLESEGGVQKTAHELIYIGTPIPFCEETFRSDIDELRQYAGVDNVRMMEVIHRIVPNYTGHAEENDALRQDTMQGS